MLPTNVTLSGRLIVHLNAHSVLLHSRYLVKDERNERSCTRTCCKMDMLRILVNSTKAYIVVNFKFLLTKTINNKKFVCGANLNHN